MATANDRKSATPAISAAVQCDPNGTPVSMVLTFSHGKSLTFRADMLSEHLKQMAIFHGVKQKLVDAAAISRDPSTGRAATIETKYAAVEEIYSRITTGGTWNKGRTGETTTGTGGLLYAALVRLYDGKQTPEAVRAFLDKKTDAEQAKMRTNPRIAPIILEIRAERAAAAAAKTPDAGGDPFAELDAMGEELGNDVDDIT